MKSGKKKKGKLWGNGQGEKEKQVNEKDVTMLNKWNSSQINDLEY